jgi:hypothetical protein
MLATITDTRLPALDHDIRRALTVHKLCTGSALRSIMNSDFGCKIAHSGGGSDRISVLFWRQHASSDWEICRCYVFELQDLGED